MPSKVPQPPPEGGPPKYASPPPPPKKKCSDCGGSGTVTISFDPPAYERCECSFTEAEWEVIALNADLSRYKAALQELRDAAEVYLNKGRMAANLGRTIRQADELLQPTPEH